MRSNVHLSRIRKSYNHFKHIGVMHCACVNLAIVDPSTAILRFDFTAAFRIVLMKDVNDGATVVSLPMIVRLCNFLNTGTDAILKINKGNMIFYAQTLGC